MFLVFLFISLRGCQSIIGHPVEITSGVSIKEIDADVYFDLQFIYFALPDVPDIIPRKKLPSCNNKTGNANFCIVKNKLENILDNNFELQDLLARMYTVKGFSAEAGRDKQATPDFAKLASLLPNNNELVDFVRANHEDWLTDTATLLTNRKEAREKRAAILPILAKGGALLLNGLPVLKSIMRKLFNDKEDMIESLLATKLLAPMGLKPFLDIFDKVSSFTLLSRSETKRIEADIKTTVDVIPNEITSFPSHPDLRRIIEAVLHVQVMLSSIGYLLHHSAIMQVHLDAATECRANNIPLAFVPVQLMKERLEQLETSIDESMVLAIPSAQALMYYKKNFATCTFDDDGGLLRVAIPIIPKGSALKLFKLQTIPFRWNENTCDIGISETYVIKDVYSGDIYIVSDVDEEACQPLKEGYCVTPKATTAETRDHICIRAIMSEQPAGIVKEICPLNCVKTDSMEIVEMDNLVIVSNLSKAAEIVCPDSTVQLSDEVLHGSVKAVIPCGCSLKVNGKAVTKSAPQVCDRTSSAKPSFEILLPVHFTRKDHWLAKPTDTSAGLRSSSLDEVLDYNWAGQDDQHDISTWIAVNWNKMSWFASSWNFMQTILLTYLMLKHRMLDARVAPLLTGHNAIAMVECAKLAEEIQLPWMIEFCIYGSFVLLMITCFPIWATKLFELITKVWNHAVQTEANTRRMEVRHELVRPSATSRSQ